MKRIFISIILFSFFILVLCQQGNLIDNVNNDNAINDDSEVEITGGIAELINVFNEEGIEYSYEVAESESEFIPGKRVFFSLFGEKFSVHQFATQDKAEDFKKQFDLGGCTIGNNKISWSDYPHFYCKWNLIIQYVGSNDDIIQTLESILGREFSGYKAVNNY